MAVYWVSRVPTTMGSSSPVSRANDHWSTIPVTASGARMAKPAMKLFRTTFEAPMGQTPTDAGKTWW